MNNRTRGVVCTLAHADSALSYLLWSGLVWFLGWSGMVGRSNFQRFPSVLQVRSTNVLFLKCDLIDIFALWYDILDWHCSIIFRQKIALAITKMSLKKYLLQIWLYNNFFQSSFNSPIIPLIAVSGGFKFVWTKCSIADAIGRPPWLVVDRVQGLLRRQHRT